MNEITNHTAELTEENNNIDGAQMGGSGIGQSSANINLDAITTKKNTIGMGNTKDRQDPMKEKEPEPKKTQGEHTQDIYNNQKQHDKIQNYLEELENEKNIMAQMQGAQIASEALTQEQLKELENFANGKSIKEIIDKTKELLNQQMAKYTDKINETKNNNNYDNRNDEQKRQDELQSKREEREDTSYQRTAQDMAKAGLNVRMLSGGGIAGSSGGSSGGGESEADKKKREKKEREERRRKQKQREEDIRLQKIRMAMGLATGISSTAMYGSMRNIGRKGITDTSNLIAENKQLKKDYEYQKKSAERFGHILSLHDR